MSRRWAPDSICKYNRIMHFSEIAFIFSFSFFNLEVICRQANGRGKATLSVHLVLCTVNCAKVGYDDTETLYCHLSSVSVLHLHTTCERNNLLETTSADLVRPNQTFVLVQ